MKRRYLAFFFALSILFSFPAVSSAGEDVEAGDLTGFIVQVHVLDDDLEDLYASGSGVLETLNYEYYLTNYHVVAEYAESPKDHAILVCVTLDPKEPPACIFKATIERSNEILDLALLRVVEVYDGDTEDYISYKEFDNKYGLTVEANKAYKKMNATTVDGEEESAEDDELKIGDDLTILGYPASGGDTITLTKGIVSGFVSEEVKGKTYVLYIKTDAKVNPGNSGGAALDENNNFIGVPSRVAGGDGNIGYIISAEVVSLFESEEDEELTKYLEEKYGPYECGENSGYEQNTGCVCDPGFEWENEEKGNYDCVPASCGEHSFHTDGEQCECEDGYEWADPEDYENVDCILPGDRVIEESFSDVPATHGNFTAIEYLKGEGIVDGYPDGKFKPKKPVNRAELLKLLIEGMDAQDFSAETYDENCFTDIRKGDWFTPYVCYAREKGWVGGYEDGSFKPDQIVSRAEAIKIILVAYAFDVASAQGMGDFLDVVPDDWFAPYASTAHEHSFIDENYGQFSPHDGMSRGDVSESLYRVIVYRDDEEAGTFERYFYNKYGFSIENPAGWERVEGGSEKPVRVYEPFQSDDDPYAENYEVWIISDDPYEEAVENFRDSLDGDPDISNVVGDDDLMIDGHQSRRFEFVVEIEGVTYYEYYYFISGESGLTYVIWLSSSESDTEAYNALFQRIAESFRLEEEETADEDEGQGEE